jgi:hypothetical protein
MLGYEPQHLEGRSSGTHIRKFRAPAPFVPLATYQRVMYAYMASTYACKR